MSTPAPRPKTYAALRQAPPPPPPTKATKRQGFGGHTSYYPKGYGISEGLKRARRPFLVPNLLVGSAVGLIAVNLYFYSIYKVKQDDFSDIKATSPLQQRTDGVAVAAPATNGSVTDPKHAV